MPSTVIRPFQRGDREQVTDLVNAHIGAVPPGVSESYRNLGEIRWLVCVPQNDAAGDALVAACGEQLGAWGVVRQGAEVSLPCPGCYGVADCWPHLRALFVRNGFRCEGRTEVILVADVADLPAGSEAPFENLTLRREMSGPVFAGVRFSALLADELVGWLDLATDLTNGGALSRLAGWCEVDTLQVSEEHRRRGIATWLIGHGADWLRLGHADRLIAYCWPEQTDALALASSAGWRELVRTERGWMRDP